MSRKTSVIIALRVIAVAAIFPALIANSRAAAPRAIRDCEKIEAADAYNECLARFGPAAREHELKHVAPKDESTFDSLSRRHRRHWARDMSHNRHATRERMEFTISPRQTRH
ncbi:MAG: hypothetical protein ACLPID_18370 [Beijerinckiaceae bacterium]